MLVVPPLAVVPPKPEEPPLLLEPPVPIGADEPPMPVLPPTFAPLPPLDLSGDELVQPTPPNANASEPSKHKALKFRRISIEVNLSRVTRQGLIVLGHRVRPS